MTTGVAAAAVLVGVTAVVEVRATAAVQMTVVLARGEERMEAEAGEGKQKGGRRGRRHGGGVKSMETAGMEK